MSDEIKVKVKEFVDIATQCPEKLQEKCFEILLSSFMTQFYIKHGNNDQSQTTATDTTKKDEPKANQAFEQEDLTDKDLHVKAKHFLNKSGIKICEINQIFYKENDEILPLYEDLKSTKAAENQIRIALLQALKNGIETGNFEFNGEEVRKECDLRKCYDSINFATIFKNNKDLFDGFTKYKKTSPIVRLSQKGKQKLAEVIKELQ